MMFSDAMNKELNYGLTENGAVKLNSTTDALVDFFAEVGALRSRDETSKATLFEEAFKEDPLLATKILFYGRDVRNGLGERQTFRDILHYAAKYHPECVRPNIHLIGEFGRWDDVYCLVDTPLEEEMWKVVQKQLKDDFEAYNSGDYKSISLLSKWLKTADASSKETRKLGIYTAKKLHTDVYHYKRLLRQLRKALKIVERDMSANRWGDINYSAVPSNAMTLYRNAFYKHDEERFIEFTNKALTGEAKINSSTLYPYDIIEKYHVVMLGPTANVIVDGNEDVLEAQWRQLPNYVEPGTNAIVIADTSGSMTGRPMNTAVGLAIYFAQHNTGAFHNLWMNFSDEPSFQRIKGGTLKQILLNINYNNWGCSTNCAAAFQVILDLAKRNHVTNDEMPKSLIIISDMEFNRCDSSDDDNWTFYDRMKMRYQLAGYDIPNIIFWNVDSRQDTFHADSNKKGVQLVSGQSASTFKQLVGSIGLTPYEMMLKVINDPIYDAITVDPKRK